MTIFELLLIAIGLMVAGGALVMWAVGGGDGRRQAAGRSAVQIELDAMHRAGRIRDLSNAAEAHMDGFVAERQADCRRGEPNIVDGEVLGVDEEPRGAGWSG